MYITNNPSVAKIAETNGTDWIFVDLETVGKEERQKGMNTVKSQHTIEDIRTIKSVLTSSELLVRVNPIHTGSEAEINAVINNGADMIMLPMWKSVEDVKTFIKYVAGRCRTMLLLETREAYENIDSILALDGIDSIHIGLNDLHLSYGMTFMFEPLANGMVETLCSKIRKTRIPYGFGGIARIGEGTLPADKIVMEHIRLGSTQVILSRSFCNTELCSDIEEVKNIFSENMRKERDFETYATTLPKEAFIKNKEEVAEIVNEIVYNIKKKRNGN